MAEYNSNDYPITIRKGDSWSFSFRYLQDDQTTPIDLTNETITFKISKRPSTSPVISLSSAEATVTVDLVAGRITVSLTAEQTSTLPSGVYQFDRVGQAGSVSTLLAGKVNVEGW